MQKIILALAFVMSVAGLGIALTNSNDNLGAMSGRDAYNYRHLTSDDAGKIVVVTSVRSILGSVIVASTTPQEIIIYDNSSATGVSTTTIASSTASKISRVKASVAEGTLTYDTMAQNGIVIGVPASFAGSYTVTWK